MDQPLKLFSFADVDRSGKVRWTAAEIGLEVEEARLEPGQHMQEEYLALNPLAQIPTVVMDGDTLIESTAICLVLAERHPEAELIPEDSGVRERFWQLVAALTTTLEQPVVNYYLGRIGVIDERWENLLAEPVAMRIRAFATQVPASGYLCGTFSLADIFAGYDLRVAIQAGLLEYSGNLGAYMDRLRARPAAVESRVFDSLKEPGR